MPVALKAALVNNPPDGEEGRLYREIGRSKPAPQGICVINTAGKVLNWALMFDDDPSVTRFLDYCLKRFAQYPDAQKSVPAERYMKFPSAKLDDVADTRNPLPIPRSHPKREYCPATPPLLPGTVVARLIGRALDKRGKPVADTVRQEHYVEERFHVPVEMQDQLARTLAAAPAARFRLPDNLARLLVSHAYLGQLDVNPVVAPAGRGDLRKSEFWGVRVSGRGREPTRLRIEGISEAAGTSLPGQGGDGRLWEHVVRLAWEGWIDLEKNRIRRLLLLAHGSERLRWGNSGMGLWGEVDVTHLPGGHPINLACGVRYGVIGLPAAATEVAVNAPHGPAGLPVAPVPEEARRQLVEVLGPTFLIFQARVHEELKLSAEQKESLNHRLAFTVQDAMAFFQKLESVEPRMREEELQSYHRQAEEKLAGFLAQTLDAQQQQRFHQLELQREGLFALGHPHVGNQLKITDTQRQQFAALVQELQRTVETVIRRAGPGGNPEEIRPRVMKLRKEQEGKIEALLTEVQRKRWKELVGKLFDLGD